jgi:hypothetical protein
MKRIFSSGGFGCASAAEEASTKTAMIAVSARMEIPKREAKHRAAASGDQGDYRPNRTRHR